MGRKNRSAVYSPAEIAIVHTICKVVRRCVLMGFDPVTRKNYDHRKVWIENELKRLASYFGIDLLAFSILSTHAHQVLRSRPDIVQSWSDREVAIRWLRLCPSRAQVKKGQRKQAAEVAAIIEQVEAIVGADLGGDCAGPPLVSSELPQSPELSEALAQLDPLASMQASAEFIPPFEFDPPEVAINKIVNNAKELSTIRLRLSDISWWMRLMCQRIAQRANAEEEEDGKFWRGRFKSIRLMDETAILACTAYVDLNVIRAALAETLESSSFTSVQRRIQALQGQEASVGSLARTRVAHEQAGMNGDGGAVVSVADFSTDHPATGTLGTGTGTPPMGELGVGERGIGELGIERQPVFAGTATSNDSKCSDDQPVRLPIHLWLAPIELVEDPNGTLCPKRKGFLPMTELEYIELLDWTARRRVPGKRGSTPEQLPPVLERLQLTPEIWCKLTTSFDELFGLAAGKPETLDNTPGPTSHRFRMTCQARELLTVVPELAVMEETKS